MTNLAQVALITLAGLTAVTFIDTVGAIASRKLNFNYGWLSILSFFVYTIIAYFNSAKTELPYVLLVSLIIGIYDATAGWKFSIAFKANSKLTAKEIEELDLKFRILGMIIVSLGFGYLGHVLYYKMIL